MSWIIVELCQFLPCQGITVQQVYCGPMKPQIGLEEPLQVMHLLQRLEIMCFQPIVNVYLPYTFRMAH